MSRAVTFTVTADVARAIDGFLKIVPAQGKVERGFDRMAQASSRAGRQMQQDARRAVAKVQQQTGGAGLALTRTARAALAGGGTGGLAVQAAAVAQMRIARAAEVRAARAAEAGARTARDLAVRDRARGVRSYDPAAPMAREAALFQHDQHVRRRWAREAAVQRGRERRAGEEAGTRALLEGDRGRGVAAYDPAQPMAREAALFMHDQHVRRRWAREAAVRRGRERQATARDSRDRLRGGLGWGVTGAAYGAVNIARTAFRGMEEYGDEVTSFSGQMRPLLGTGDNYKRRAQIAQEVLAYSGALGVDREQVISARQTIDAGGANLSQTVRDALLKGAGDFYRLQGSDMQTTAKALNAAVQILGKELPRGPGGVREYTNKLAYAADVGSFEVDEVTPYLGMVHAAFQGMGFKHEDALASMVIASKSGARPEQYSTAVRNLALQMPEIRQKLGGNLSEDFATAMEQIARIDTPEMLEMVGRDSFAAAKAIADNAMEVRRLTDLMKRLNGAVDVILPKIIGNSTPTQQNIDVIESARQGQANAVAAAAGVDPTVLDNIAQWELTKEGAAITYAGSPVFRALGLHHVSAASEYLQDKTLGNTPEASNLFRLGLAQRISDYKQAGNTTAAATLELKHGELTDTYWTDKQGKKQYADESDAVAVTELARQGYVMSAGQYQHLESLQHNKRYDAAAKYLSRFKRNVDDPTKEPQAAAGALMRQAAELNMQAAKILENGGRSDAGPQVGAGNNAPE